MLHVRQRQRRRTRTQDCYIWHHIFLTHIVTQHSGPHFCLPAESHLAPRAMPKQLLLWLPASLDWSPVLRGLKLCVYIIFSTLTCFLSSSQHTWFVSVIPLLTLMHFTSCLHDHWLMGLSMVNMQQIQVVKRSLLKIKKTYSWIW